MSFFADWAQQVENREHNHQYGSGKPNHTTTHPFEGCPNGTNNRNDVIQVPIFGKIPSFLAFLIHFGFIYLFPQMISDRLQNRSLSGQLLTLVPAFLSHSRRLD